MKAYILAIGAILLFINTAFSQNPSISKNYVMATTVRVPGKTDSVNLIGLTVWEANRNVQYIDGFGRPLQNIQWKASPLMRDVVQHNVYDAVGRESIKYLPYADPDTTGKFKTSALSNQADFYSLSNSWDANIAKTIYPFSETKFEQSPLNRMLEQGAPGSAWQPAGSRSNTGRTVVAGYGTNHATEVKKWIISGSTITGSSYYQAGKLFKSITKDENWVSGNAGTMEEFKDSDGRIILKKVWQTEAIALYTYYIYDDFGNLRYVLPPAVTVSSFAITDDVFLKFIYGYNYDNKNRLVEKHIPGKGWERMVYNRLDQLVMSQNAKQHADGKWAFVKYDALGRVIITGIVSKDTSWVDWQTKFNSLPTTAKLYESLENPSASQIGYSNTVSPQVALTDCMVINYYDEYNFYGNSANYDPTSASISYKLKGLKTGSKTQVIDGNKQMTTVFYYDDEGRVIETVADNHLTDGKDRIQYTYNFAGELLGKLRTHIKGSAATTIANVYTYDHMGRKRYSKANINEKGGIWLSRLDYNEIGQLKQKSLHSTDEGLSFLQYTKYIYNERGWLKNSESPQFNMKLGYQEAVNPQYNGNIASQQWGVNYTSQSLNTYDNQFLYTYDKLNRLASGISTGIIMSEIIRYDAMGNIDSLTRNGVLGTYTYNGNKLTSIAGGTMATGNYAYDVNGNAITDGRTGVTISYNHLNLPKMVDRLSPGLNMAYTYDGTGKKLKTTITKSGTTTYDYVDGIHYTDNAIQFIQTEEGVARNNGGTYSYEYNLNDHLGNVRYTFKQNNTTGAITPLQVDDYFAFGLRKSFLPSSTDNKYLYNGKELQDELGLYDYGARFYDPVIGRWNSVDILAQKTFNINPYAYGKNNPISMVDNSGNYAVSVHYNITYKALLALGYSKREADLMAHYSSTYADHPTTNIRFADFMGHPFETKTHPYRSGINYNKTKDSQLEKNSSWHSMMSDEEAEKGWTREQATARGLKFGWDNVFGSDGGKDLGKLGQGIHALQDAIAHGGMATHEHLGKNWSSVKQTLYKDMYGSTKEASNLTRSAGIVTRLMAGKSVTFKKDEELNFNGMSRNQFTTVINLLMKQGFSGTIKMN